MMTDDLPARYARDEHCRRHREDKAVQPGHLGAECLRCRQIHAVVVSQVIVRYDRCRLDASTDQEIDQHGLHFRLSGLEVIAANQDTLFNLKQ
jgi:hypothetical protein